MATLESLQKIRLLLTGLMFLNTIVMIVLIFCVDDYYYWMSINFLIYICLVVALYSVIFKMRRLFMQQNGIVAVSRGVVVIAPAGGPQQGQVAPPPPGFVTAASGLPPAYSPAAPAGSDQPPPYSQVGPWTTQQSQPSAYSQSAFGQPSAYSQSAFGQPLTSGGQTGQNSYWDPSK